MLCFYGAKYMNNKSIYALGFFDGVHLGHQALLTQCCRLARERNMQTSAITFQQHPLSAFTDDPPPLINTTADREVLLRQYGIANIDSLPVTKDVMSTSWQDFLLQLMEKGAAGFVCGNDFRFGKDGEGDARKLRTFCQEQNLPWVIVPEQTLDGIRISSSHIRSLLENGDAETANRFLGHPHILSGTVVPGKQLGRTIGIPTANLLLPKELLIPKFGVYATLVCIDGEKHPAVTNIGTRPTVEGQGITVEPWILDFDGDLYGKKITLEFHQFLRPEKKFATLADLQEEIRKNGAQTRNFFEKT